MNIRKQLRKLTAIVLVIAMACPSTVTSFAGTAAEAVEVEGTHLSEELVPEGRDIVYFGATALTVSEKETTYIVPVYREGSEEYLSKGEEITVHSQDISALYGKDYRLLGEGKTETPHEKTILEMVSKQDSQAAQKSITAEKASNSDAIKITENGETGLEQTAEAEETGSSEALLGTEFELEETGVSSLAMLKQKQTGNPTREEGSSDLAATLTEAVLAQVIPEMLSEIMYSCEQKIEFKPGEAETQIRFQILNDQLTEGSEMFNLMITGAQEGEPYGATALSVCIEDDEAVEHSVLSFTSDSFSGKNGSVKVEISRTGALYSMATAKLRAALSTTDPETGETATEDKVLGEVVFMPYEETKEAELSLSGDAEIFLYDLMAADAGERMTAAVHMENEDPEEDGEEDGEDTGLLGTARGEEFTVKINGVDYKVRSEKNSAYGRIWDTRFRPELEVGLYVFPASTDKNGWFTYGIYEGYDTSNRHSKYDEGNNRADLYWYNWRTWKEGNSNTEIQGNHPELGGIYYQYVVPDWEQNRTFGGGQESWFRVLNSSGTISGKRTIREGEFGRGLNAHDAVQIKNENNYLKVKATAADVKSGRTPKIQVYMYGTAFMYKRFEISTQNPVGVKFKHGKEWTDETLPFQFTVKCGAQTWASTEKRNIFANIDKDKSNLVFTTKETKVNGNLDKYGIITGFQITVSPGGGNDMVRLEYPKDFLAWLDGSHSQSGSTPISWNRTDIQKEKDIVNAHLDTIPYDEYFISWIESVQKKVFSDGMNDKAYYQMLDFKPTYKLIDSQVKVLAPEGTEAGSAAVASFDDAELVNGKTLTYHAGDVLDLHVKINDKTKESEYTIIGYDVSTNGGASFDTIRGNWELQLQPYKNYVIRPVVAKKTNGIEVVFEKGAEAILSLENQLIPQSELEKYPELKGRYFLNLNPNAKTVEEKMKVEPGKNYSVNVIVNQAPVDRNYVYRPVFTDPMTGKTYNGQRYDLIGRSTQSDNRIRVGVEQVKQSDLLTYDLSGLVLVAVPAINNDSLGLHKTAATGYRAAIGNGQDSRKDSRTGKYVDYVKTVDCDVNTNGRFQLLQVSAKAGDRFTLLLSNGVADGQIREVEFGTKGIISLGEIDLSYPTAAPAVTSLSYRYMIDANNHKTDITSNTVRMFDDELQITATVRRNGQKIEKLVFQSVSPKSGITKNYEIKAEKEDQDVFIIRLPNLLKFFNNGDRISVSIVTKQTATVDGKETAVSIELPKVETGYVMYTENELIMPKEFSLYYDPSELTKDVKIPIIGSAIGNAQSGKMGLSRLDWPEGGGYSLIVNLDALLFQTSGSYTPAQKKQALSEYRENAAKVAAGNAEKQKEKRNASIPDQSNNGNAPLAQIIGQQKVKEAVDQEKIRQGAEAKAAMTSDAKVEFHMLFCLDLEFIYNPKTLEYTLCSVAVTIGGTGSIDKTFYTVIYGVPCYLNLNGSGNASLTMGGVTDSAKGAFTDGDFNNFSGNVKDMLSGSGNFMIQLDLAFTGKGQAGVGVCGILGARGFITVGTEIQFVENRVCDDHAGFVLNGSGGIGLDLLFFSFDFTFINAAKGWGSLKDQTKVTMFNDTTSLLSTGDAQTLEAEENPEAAEEEELEDSPDEGVLELDDTITFTPYSAGTDVSAFGSYQELSEEMLGAQPVKAGSEILLTPAATRTRPQLVDLGDGRELITFLGAKGSDQESSVLYYSVRGLDEKWSVPVAVSDNGSYQSQSSTLKIGNKIYLAWLETGASFKKGSGYAEQLSSLEIRLTALEYDPQTGKIKDGERKILDFCQLPYMPSGLRLTEENGRLFCSYLLTDYQKVEKETELADLNRNYTTDAVTEIDPETMTVVPYKYQGVSYKERLIEIKHSKLTDPLVLDSQTEAVMIGSGSDARELLVSAYTVNDTTALETDDARELYLRIEDVTGGNLKQYYPIRLTNDNEGEAFPTLTKLNGNLYLTWIAGGDSFHMMDVSAMLNAMYAPDCELENDEAGSRKINDTVRAQFLAADPVSPTWYQKTAAELGMPEEVYENSLYQKLCESDFNIEVTGIGCNKIGVHNITNHQLVSDGTDVYVLYTDITADPENNGVELYGMRCTSGGKNTSVEENDEPYSKIAFTDSVQISNEGLVMDEISAFMNEEREIYTASNLFSQSIGTDGKMVYGENALVHTCYLPQQSVQVKDSKLEIPEYLVPGTNELVTFDVINEGLLPSKGIYIKVLEETPDGKINFLMDQSFPAVLDPNESYRISVPWTVPEHAEGTVFSVLVQEEDVQLPSRREVTASIPVEEHLSLGAAECTVGEDGRLHVTGNVSNTGNRASEETELVLSLLQGEKEGSEGDNTYKTEEITRVRIPSLESGEVYETDLSFKLTSDQFNNSGQVRMLEELKEDNIVYDNVYPVFSAQRPVIAEIGGGAEQIRIARGTTKKIDAGVAPWKELSGELQYASMNNDIAEISKDGMLTGKKNGITMVAVYDPKNCLYSETKVLVTDTVPEDDESSSTSQSLPAWVVKDGSWKTTADGKWQYVRDGKPVADSWLCIYNPYADSKKNQKFYAWFHFDKDGWMQTGWFDDKDGNRYYLSPVSDGTKGYMLSGWKQLDGKWYYFSEKEGSGTFGALLRNTTTPDGYKVDKNGVWVK